jgi:hypothetical protein
METMWPDSITRMVERQTEDLQRKLTRLTAERTALDEQINQAERDLDELQIAVKVYRKFAEVPTPIQPRPRSRGAGPPPTATDGTDGSDGTLGRLEGITLAEAATMALRFLGGSAATGELRDLLVNRGALKPTRNAYVYLLKTMRDKPNRFVNLERGTWALKEAVDVSG